MKKQQILFINWWESRENYKNYIEYLEKLEYNPFEIKAMKWRYTFTEDLWEKFFVLNPQMPNKDFASYDEWKIMFEKTFKYLEDNIILIWHSLGATFLTKYLIENNFPVSIKKIILIAWATKDSKNEVLWDFTFDKTSKELKKYENKIILYHSKDDPVVPFYDLNYYKQIIPNAEYNIFENKGHFIEEKFPELIERLKEIK